MKGMKNWKKEGIKKQTVSYQETKSESIFMDQWCLLSSLLRDCCVRCFVNNIVEEPEMC